MKTGWLALGIAGFLTTGTFERAMAVIFYSTGDPSHNTTAPTGPLADSGWDLQGDAFPGIPIAPNFFITATHVGGDAGGTYVFRGVSYRMLSAVSHPDADLTIWRVDKNFPAYAALYTGADEVGRPLVVFGRGCERGDEVRENGVLKGWLWGRTDGLLRWGENVVAGISDQDGNPANDSTPFQLLRADFDANGGPNEAHLSGGDSGGGVFLRDGTVWKLAGVNHAANKDYSYTATGDGFAATLFDEGGLFELQMGQRVYHPEDPWNAQPGSFYATRISTYASWIQSVVTSGGGDDAAIVLEEAGTPAGPYRPVEEATVDSAANQVRIPRPVGTRFYRVMGSQAHVIESVNNLGTQLVLSYR